MIAIVDYGAGNPVSVKKALDWLGQECAITADPKCVATADRIVLPGVGHLRRPRIWAARDCRMRL